jgi:capsular polysaccharide biosynthesis protein
MATRPAPWPKQVMVFDTARAKRCVGGDMNGTTKDPAGNFPPPREEVTTTPQGKPLGEIDLVDLFKIIWSAKILILIAILLTTATAVYLAYSRPNTYRSEAVLLYKQPNMHSPESASEIFKSRSFFADFLKHYPELISSFQYSTIQASASSSSSSVDTQRMFNTYKRRLRVKVDRRTKVVKISIEMPTPQSAKAWIDALVRHINNSQQIRDRKKIDANIDYLSVQKDRLINLGGNEAINDIIAGQVRKKMDADIDVEYFFETLSPAYAPLGKSGPNRPVFIIAGIFLGFTVGLILAVLKSVVWQRASRP